MKAAKLILCFVAMATMVFAGCTKVDNGGDNNGGNNNSSNTSSNVLNGTNWYLASPDDEVYHADVNYVVNFTSTGTVSFHRQIDYGDSIIDYLMIGDSYTYNDGSGVVMLHNVGETTDNRITFTVSGDTLKWNFNLREITLHKI